MDKPFWASKTLWANLVAFVAVLATTFGLDLGLDPETQLSLVGGVMALVNIALRFVTDTPIAPVVETDA
jgi:hypothetical protein